MNPLWSSLDPRISKAIQLCGYKEPTPIQSECFPTILSGKDLVASAPTGTGKTAAFILPTLQRLVVKRSLKPRVLILAPTRELATQISQEIKRYAKFLNMSLTHLVGGMPYHGQIRDLARPHEIVVATPGRLLDHLENKKVDLSLIETFILDEADRMLDMGFIEDIQTIAKKIPKSHQTLLFSATMDEKVSQIILKLLKDHVRIDCTAKKNISQQIQQKYYWADNFHHKKKLLNHILKNESIYKGIIFSSTKINVMALADELSSDGFKVGELHGDLNQNKRNRMVELLRRDKIQFLVATDVAARGIDIPDITHVINYDLPKFSEDYVHRIGRTGRVGKSGIAISFVLHDESRDLKKIEKRMACSLEKETILGLEPQKTPKKSVSPNHPKRRFHRRFK